MKTRTILPLLALALVAMGCQKSDDKKSKKSPTAAKAAAGADQGQAKGHECGKKDCSGDCNDCGADCDKNKQHAAAGGEAKHECGGDKAAHGEEDHECAGCGADTETKLIADHVEERTDDQGRKVLHAGQDFTKASVATVADVMAKPADFMGKTVTLEGDVSAMCGHKRAWFAMVGTGDKSGQQLRVFTTPVFLVPADSIGKSVRVEGKVDEVEIPKEAAEHFAKEHKLPMPEGDGPFTQPVLRAIGADYY